MDYYNLTTTNLCTKNKIGQNKLLAAIQELKIQQNPEAFKEIKLGSQVHKRYSPLALDILKKELPKMDIEKVWQRNRPISKKTKR